ncbi:MAG: aspartate aminotransferase family protein, partial [Bacteroidetes bacterium]|nr:aspartate aminotransferase family protein [Bacteroidota bacterium]
MFTYWKKRSQEEIKTIIFKALDNNVNYVKQNVLGIPASYLDEKVFNQDASFVKDAPFISTLIQNPNHIGCHTLGKSEHYFQGTHEVEKELIEICAVDILKGNPCEQDGYVASGGTEANIQAIWIYRNYF